MAAPTIEITIVYVGEKWRRPDAEDGDDFLIGWGKLVECASLGGSSKASVTVGSRFCFLGNVPRGGDAAGGMDPGLEYCLYGHWENKEVFGRQFVHKDFRRSEPHSREGVVRYLSQAPNVGQATALALWNKFGSSAVRTLRESPDVAVAAIGRQFTQSKADEAAKYLQKMAALENVTIDMIDLLGGRGMPKSLAKKCIERWGNSAPAIVKADPYKLMKFKGVWFLKADAMYTDLGLPPWKLKRQAYCATYTVIKECDSQGHTWVPLSKAVAGIKAHVGGVECEPEKAIMLATRGKILSIRRDANGESWAADIRRAEAEAYVAKRIAEAMQEEANWPEIDCVNGEPGESGPTVHQWQELVKACRGTIGVFGGSPGTGKTYTVGALSRAIIAEHGIGRLAVATPTGKAAVRCTESLAANGVSIQATTIHRLLVVESAEEGWSFKHNERLPLPFKFVIIDESSMIDAGLMASLLAARARGTHLLFVGDVNQLPPVGHGAPLRDFIAAGLPYGELREIKRNAGSIVRACAAIRDGEQFECDDELRPYDKENPRNLKLIPAGRDSAPRKILELVEKIRNHGKLDPIWDVQVVVAVNAKSGLSRKALNKELQGLLNADGKQVKGSPFRVGDKVIMLKNGFLKVTDDPAAVNAEMDAAWSGQSAARGIDFSRLGRVRLDPFDPDFGEYTPPKKTAADKPDEKKVFVANGEIGRVLDVAEKKTIVEFSNPRRIVLIPRGAGGKESGGEGDSDGGEGSESESSGTGCDLDLSYAITVHKAQGASAPCIIVALDEYPGATGPHGICDRSWIYTAISRAEKVCFLVGKMSTARTMCEKQSIQRRKTFLVERIAEEAASLGLKGATDAAIVDHLPPDGEQLAVGVECDGGNPAAAEIDELDAADSLF